MQNRLPGIRTPAANSIAHPQGLLAGFHAESLSECPELKHCGEQWMPGDFDVGRQSHQGCEIYYLVSGSSRWQVGNTLHDVCAGNLLLIPPNTSHHPHGAGPQAHHALYLCVDLEPIFERKPALRPAWGKYQSQVIKDAGAVYESIRFLIREVTIHSPYRSEGLQTALDAVVLCVSRLRSGIRSQSLVQTHPGILRARDEMEKCVQEPWGISRLAGIAGLSQARFTALFRKHVGLSPHQFLLAARIERAKDMMRSSNADITEIAHGLGFCSSQHFSCAFRKATGISPSHFRQREG